MKSNKLIFQIAAVFIGTIVGAGLASGQEITQFFTVYGGKSFISIFLCLLLYIFVGNIIIIISSTYNINSYKELIELVSKGILGKIIDLSTGFFLISSSAIILAGSGSLLKQYFNLPKWVGVVIMAFLSLFVLLRDTKGLIEINSFIVPSLIIIISLTFSLYIILNKKDINILKLISLGEKSNFYLIYYSDKLNLHFIKTYLFFISSILYAGFNLLSCSGVIVPLVHEIKDRKKIIKGLYLGSIILTILTIMINYLLIINQPYIYKYDIPLLYIVKIFGKPLQIALLIVIWLEMFSTEVSDIYSVGKAMESSFNINYKWSVLLIISLAIPISSIGFVSLISVLYPLFGVISFIFMVQCIIFYIRKKKELE